MAHTTDDTPKRAQVLRRSEVLIPCDWRDIVMRASGAENEREGLLIAVAGYIMTELAREMLRLEDRITELTTAPVEGDDD